MESWNTTPFSSCPSAVRRGLQAEPVYKFDEIDVKTFNGTVQLSGFVDVAGRRNLRRDAFIGADHGSESQKYHEWGAIADCRSQIAEVKP